MLKNEDGKIESLSFERLCEEDVVTIKDIAGWLRGCSPEKVKIFLSDKNNIAFVAKLENKLIGLIYGYSLTRMDGKKPQFFIYSVEIHPEHQNKGYGSRFVKWVVDWAMQNGFCESFVPTDKDNIPACTVYEKAGMSHSKSDCERIYVIEYSSR